MKENINIAIVQYGPKYNNLQKSLEKAKSLIETAGSNGAKLIVFGESWLCGYPFWLDVCPETAIWNNETVKEVYLQMYNSSICIPGKETEILSELAKKNKIIVCIGVNEKVQSGIGNGTIYNSFLIINNDGKILNHHRKLVPTFTEKLVYGNGDGAGLKSVETDIGRIGGLICWEHWIPLARQVMHNSGESIHIALWPTVHEMHQIACRNYAFEGRCYVIAVGQILKVKDIPKGLILPDKMSDDLDKQLHSGGSCVVGPKGNYILEPQFNVENIIYCSIPDIGELTKEKMALDISGHYNRWDIFDFNVNMKRK
jgi:nitrilase